MHPWRISAAILLAGMAGLTGCGTGTTIDAPAPSVAKSSSNPRPAHGSARALDVTKLWMSTAHDGVGISPQGMYITRDGGRHWTTVSLPGPSRAALAQGLPSGTSTAYLVTVGLAPNGIVWMIKQMPAHAQLDVYWTPNRGRTWYGGSLTTHLFSQGVPLSVQNMSFLGRHRAWLSVQPQHGMNSMPGDLWYSDSGGKTWRRLAANPPETGSRGWPVGGAVSFTAPSQGWDMGPQTTTSPHLLWRTQNGAKQWTRVALPGYAPSQVSVIAPPQFFGKRGILAVEYEPTNGMAADFSTMLYHSSQGGRTWIPSTSVPASPSPIIDSISATTTWIWTGYQDNSYAGAPVHGTLEVTTDGGTHWFQHRPTGILHRLMAQGYSITDLDFLNRRQGWATTAKLSSSRDGPLLETQNGGRTWQQFTPIVVSLAARPHGA